MCRLHITNLSYKTLYMKDWFIKDTCIRVYDSKIRNEIAILHCDPCGKGKPCSDYPRSFKRGVKFEDEIGLIHLHSGTSLKRNSTPTEVDWDVLNYNIYYYKE